MSPLGKRTSVEGCGKGYERTGDVRDRRRRRRRRRRWRKRENTRFSRRHGAEVQAAAVIVQFAGKGKYRRILGAKGDWHGSRGGTSNAQKSRLENWRRDETWSKGAFTWSIVSARMPPTFLPASVYDLARCQLYIDSAVIKKKEQPSTVWATVFPRAVAHYIGNVQTCNFQQIQLSTDDKMDLLAAIEFWIFADTKNEGNSLPQVSMLE